MVKTEKCAGRSGRESKGLEGMWAPQGQVRVNDGTGEQPEAVTTYQMEVCNLLS